MYVESFEVNAKKELLWGLWVNPILHEPETEHLGSGHAPLRAFKVSELGF